MFRTLTPAKDATSAKPPVKPIQPKEAFANVPPTEAFANVPPTEAFANIAETPAAPVRNLDGVEWELKTLLPLVDQLTPEELLQMRDYVDSRLPVKMLKDMNLEHELVMQFQVAKVLQTETLSSDDEANKKAQTVNSCASVLQQLVKMQSEFHTAERLKEIEVRLIRSLEKIPENHLRDFFEWYESEANT